MRLYLVMDVTWGHDTAYPFHDGTTYCFRRRLLAEGAAFRLQKLHKGRVLDVASVHFPDFQNQE